MTFAQSRPWLVPIVVACVFALCGPAVGQEARPEGGAPPGDTPPQAAPRAEPKASPKPERRGPRPGDVQKVFVLQHVRPGYLTRLLRVFPAEISSAGPREGGASALAVSAKPAVLAAIEETVKRLDQPGTDSGTAGNVELTGYVLEGSTEAEHTEALPSDLEGVVAQLRRAFKFPTYRLLDTVVARARDGSGFKVDGVTERRLSGQGPSFYELRAGRTDVAAGAAPRIVRLTGFRFSLEIPVVLGPPPADNSKPLPFEYKSVGLQSDIDVRDGQYTVVGKSGLGSSENALVLVLTARVVD